MTALSARRLAVVVLEKTTQVSAMTASQNQSKTEGEEMLDEKIRKTMTNLIGVIRDSDVPDEVAMSEEELKGHIGDMIDLCNSFMSVPDKTAEGPLSPDERRAFTQTAFYPRDTQHHAWACRYEETVSDLETKLETSQRGAEEMKQAMASERSEVIEYLRDLDTRGAMTTKVRRTTLIRNMIKSSANYCPSDPEVENYGIMISDDERHCDTYIADYDAPMSLRWWLLVNRLPAVEKPIARLHSARPVVLYAKNNGFWVKLTMASRFGDVGITRSLDAENGYDERVPIKELADFTDVHPDSKTRVRM